MSGSDRRAVLEAIAYGPDRSIRPGERLRAIELLTEDGDDREPVDLALFRRVQSLDGEALRAESDGMLAGLLVAQGEDERRAMWPLTCAAIESRIEARAQELARELAGEMYRTRQFEVLDGGEDEVGLDPAAEPL